MDLVSAFLPSDAVADTRSRRRCSWAVIFTHHVAVTYMYISRRPVCLPVGVTVTADGLALLAGSILAIRRPHQSESHYAVYASYFVLARGSTELFGMEPSTKRHRLFCRFSQNQYTVQWVHQLSCTLLYYFVLLIVHVISSCCAGPLV